MSGISTVPPGSAAPRQARLSCPDSPRASGATAGRPVRRVRHEVRDGVVVMLFSAFTSSGLALLLTVLPRLGN